MGRKSNRQNDGVGVADAQGPILDGDACRVDRARWMDLAESQTWMGRILAKQQVCFACLSTDSIW
jgi:hypothetical protein